MDLGLERAGHRVIWQSEIDEYANKVLAKHWPDVPNLGDVTKIDWKQTPYVDIIAGGYPCQPFSTAGKRRGTADPRHLWPHFRNAIGAVRPRYALLENVPGHVSLGLPTVLSDLSTLGYCAEWQIISAAAFNAPHLRERLFIVAYPDSDSETDGRQREAVQGKSVERGNDRNRSKRNSGQIGLGNAGQIASVVADTDNARGGTPKRRIDGNGSAQIQRREIFTQSEPCRCGENVADTNGGRFQKRNQTVGAISIVDTVSTGRLCQWWETEPNVDRVADGVSHRLDRLRGLGNAVVPQVAEFVGLLIGEHAKTI